MMCKLVQMIPSPQLSSLESFAILQISHKLNNVFDSIIFYVSYTGFNSVAVYSFCILTMVTYVWFIEHRPTFLGWDRKKLLYFDIHSYHWNNVATIGHHKLSSELNTFALLFIVLHDILSCQIWLISISLLICVFMS